ncbi:ABC transporter permease [Streptomyces sp. NPDC002952]|uniref:ABC transporter permease n=1 Tax=Streptomyces sp. NPDC002952 TaxID=3364673 RepID=UPI0036D0B764
MALGRAEMMMLVRNRTALTSALALPLGSLWLMRSTTPSSYATESGDELEAAPVLATGTIGMVLLFVVYSTLVSAYVARREGLVLKRLRTGQLADGEVLAGTALPAVLVALLQCGIVIGVGMTVLHVRAPADPLLLGAGVLLGTVLVAALAAVSSALTRTVEMAQLTTMPLLLVSVAGSGLVLPLTAMPGRLADLCHLLPLTPVMETVRIGWLGAESGTWSAGMPHLGGAALWTAVAVWAAARLFRWDPRK